jgi:hypothetical protein
MVSSQIKILKIQKKDREANEWEKLTNFEGVFEMIWNLEALAEGIRDAVKKYKNSREYRSVATRLTVKLNEILEIIFRWEQRLLHLSLPTSPKEDEKRSPKTPPSIPRVATVEDIIMAQLEEREISIVRYPNTMEDVIQAMDANQRITFIDAIIDRLNALSQRIREILETKIIIRGEIKIGEHIIDDFIAEHLDNRITDINLLIDEWRQMYP